MIDTGVTQTNFLVDRRDFATTTIQSAPLTLETGEALLAVEIFALTANNLTYALMGDSAHYWDFFPSDADWGRIPVWGFGRVISPGACDLAVGERLYGYFPMSSYATMRVGKLDQGGCYDLSAHRAKLSPVYHYYARVSFDPDAEIKRAHEDMLLRPVFYASFLVHDYLSDEGFRDAGTVIVTSASSKVAIGLAWLLSNDKPRRRIVGVTSAANLPFVEGLGIYDRVVDYGQIAALERAPALVADLSGNAAVMAQILAHFGDDIQECCQVGYTHWNAHDAAIADDPRVHPFFVPDRMRQRTREWGFAEFARRYDQAFRAYAAFSRSWLDVIEGRGADAVARAFHRIRQNGADPRNGHVLSLWEQAGA